MRRREGLKKKRNRKKPTTNPCSYSPSSATFASFASSLIILLSSLPCLSSSQTHTHAHSEKSCLPSSIRSALSHVPLPFPFTLLRAGEGKNRGVGREGEGGDWPSRRPLFQMVISCRFSFWRGSCPLSFPAALSLRLSLPHSPFAFWWIFYTHPSIATFAFNLLRLLPSHFHFSLCCRPHWQSPSIICLFIMDSSSWFARLRRSCHWNDRLGKRVAVGKRHVPVGRWKRTHTQ